MQLRVGFGTHSLGYLKKARDKCLRMSEKLTVLVDQNSIVGAADVNSPRLSDIRFSPRYAMVADEVIYETPNGCFMRLKG